MSFDPTGLDPTAALAILFLSALIASTVFPMQSEAVLVGALYVDGVDPVAAVAVATVGNTIGGQINWLLGRMARMLQHKWWFPVTPKMLDKAEHWYERWGVWSLLLCWTPWLGDPLTVAAGVLKTPFWQFTAITLPARLARYAVVVWAFYAL